VQSSPPAGPESGQERDGSRGLLPQLGHELRTPVQVIAGFLELLLAEEAGPLSAEQRRYLKEIRRSCERLARFADELSAGEDAAVHPLRPQRAPLAPLAESVRAALKPCMERRRQTLRVRIAPAAEHGCFDPARVLQVLHNLVANASEHGAEGAAIDLEAERVSGLCGAELSVSVSDAGPGLRGEARGAAATRPGRGLGLSICRAIVAAHGGSLRVEDAPGGGTRVRFTLPGSPEAPS
jgi:signal transduction histidine kinase